MILDTAKSMLEHREEILRKLDGLARYKGTFDDKHDVDDDGNPKTKPFVPPNLRDAPSLNCSKWVRTEPRVNHVFREIETEL